MTVRPRRTDDLQACLAALAEVHRRDGYPTRWPADPSDWLSPEGLVAAWVAGDDGTVQGHVALKAGVDDDLLAEAAGRPTAELAMVSRLFVRPAARGGRLGEALLSAVRAYADQHALGLVLDVVAEPRSAAIALYERLGWRLVGQRTATWSTPSGEHPRMLLYVMP